MRILDLYNNCLAAGFAPQTLGLETLPPALPDQLETYLALLLKWNKAMNLVGFNDAQRIFEQLVLDSFHLAVFLKELEAEAPGSVFAECWDLGAGAGLPGIPLRMLWQNGQYTLVELREKRALFLRSVLAACPLPGVKVFQGRAEAFMPQRPKASLVLSRAFMPWLKVLELVRPWVADSGLAVFLTLAPYAAEADAEMQHPGWELAREQAYYVPGKNGGLGKNGVPGKNGSEKSKRWLRAMRRVEHA